MEEKKLTPMQKKVKAILDKTLAFFSTKKEIERIKVFAGTNKFWASNPKKIKYWKSRAEQCAKVGMLSNSYPSVRITKVVYKS